MFLGEVTSGLENLSLTSKKCSSASFSLSSSDDSKLFRRAFSSLNSEISLEKSDLNESTIC
ncbi:hypothetical protein HRED_03030 [Candidatus Haloredivivus sp. G17]|nr:hypothetical protein HRED_03030 [Candidatus Haloredivivus sp. G17]